MYGPELRHLGAELVAVELDADELPVDALRPDPLQRVLADVVLWLVLDEPLQTHHVQRRVGDRHIRAVVEDARLDTARLAGCDRLDTELLPRVGDGAPEFVALGAVEEVHLEAGDRRPPGAADQHGHAADLDLRSE